MAALKRRKMLESEIEKLQSTRFQLEMQVSTLESASFNQETMAAMKKAAGALKDIHGTLCVRSRCVHSHRTNGRSVYLLSVSRGESYVI